MLFNSLQYAVFLPVVWLLFWLSPQRWRWDLLLIASYVFYASWSIPYAFLILVLAILNYLFGIGIGACRPDRKRLLLWACISFDIGVLAFFKYTNFALASVARAAHLAAGTGWEPPLLNLALPLGISFFTFEFIHYLVDVSHGDVPVHSFSRFHLFAAFFPTQISGPIKRFQTFVPALEGVPKVDPAILKSGVLLIGTGLLKKMLLADTLSPIADAGFSNGAPFGLNGVEAWTAVLAFSLQIYFDFSGYTDIARGSARLFGLEIPLNFNAPYLATSLSQFWRRWHISLSSWLRDYLYIPLGGSRVGVGRAAGNLVVTMLIGGLWHGAAWHFVIWGAFWGVLQVGERFLGRAAGGQGRMAAFLPVALRWAVTQLFVLFGWVLFRASDMPTALAMYRDLLFAGSVSGIIPPSSTLYVILVALGLLAFWGMARSPLLTRVPSRWQPVGVGVVLAVVAVFEVIAGSQGSQRFIYFQF